METEISWSHAETEERPANIAMNWVLEDGKRTKGRSQKTWHMTFSEDLQGMGLTWRGARRVVNNDQQQRNIDARYSNLN